MSREFTISLKPRRRTITSTVGYGSNSASKSVNKLYFDVANTSSRIKNLELLSCEVYLVLLLSPCRRIPGGIERTGVNTITLNLCHRENRALQISLQVQVSVQV